MRCGEWPRHEIAVPAPSLWPLRLEEPHERCHAVASRLVWLFDQVFWHAQVPRDGVRFTIPAKASTRPARLPTRAGGSRSRRNSTACHTRQAGGEPA